MRTQWSLVILNQNGSKGLCFANCKSKFQIYATSNSDVILVMNNNSRASSWEVYYARGRRRGTGTRIFYKYPSVVLSIWSRVEALRTQTPPTAHLLKQQMRVGLGSLFNTGSRLWFSLCVRERRERAGWTGKAELTGGFYYFILPHPPGIYSSNDAPKRPLDSKLIKCLLGSQAVIYFSKDASIISKEKPGYIFKTQEQQLLNLFRLMSTYKFGEC